MTQVLEIINYTFLLIFGTIVSVSFAGYEKTTKNRKAIVLLIFAILGMQLVSYFLLGLMVTAKLYPFITHVPSILFIVVYLKKPLPIAIVSVLTSYLCCQPPNWVGLALQYSWESSISFHVGYTVGLLIMLYLIKKYVAASVHQVMSYSRWSLYLFGSFPLIYYVFDYTTTIYTGFLYSGTKVIVEFFPSVISMFYIVFIIVYNNEMHRRSRLELNNLMLQTKSDQAANEISVLRQVQNQTSIYRHDMRHHLSLLHSFLEEGHVEKAMEYIQQTQTDIDKIVPQRYCENNTINLIFSAFANKAKQKKVQFTIEAVVPKNLPLPDTDICTLLANGLENAISAASTGRNSLENPPKSAVRASCHIHKGNLLILIENTLHEEVEMENGLPHTEEEGHGYGTKSIQMLVDRHQGYYSFSAESGLFTLQIVLPLGKSTEEPI